MPKEAFGIATQNDGTSDGAGPGGKVNNSRPELTGYANFGNKTCRGSSHGRFSHRDDLSPDETHQNRGIAKICREGARPRFM